MKRLALLGMFVVAACAPHLVSGNEAGGIVRITGTLGGQAKAMTIADGNCKRFGKVALSEGVNELRGTMRYRCVTP